MAANTGGVITSNDNEPSPMAETDLLNHFEIETPEATSMTDPEKPAVESPSGGSDRSSEEAPGRPVTGWRWGLVCVAVFTTNFLYGLDNTIVADIQGAVVTQFNQVDKITWLGSGFPLGSIAIILAVGKAYGVFNIKYLWIANIMTFELGSVICGAAPTMDVLIVGRVIGGMGAAGMYLGCLNIFTTFTAVNERPIYMSLVSVVWGIGTILGPVVGGAFADSTATWRWAFYINLVLLGVMAPVFIWMVPSYQPQPGKSAVRKLLEFDWMGIVLNAGIYTTWILNLQFAGSTWAWSDGRTIALFVVLGVLIILFTLQQYFCIFTTPEQRIFPGEFLKSRTMMLLFFCMNCVTAASFIVIFYIPVFFEFVHGDTGINSSVRLLPFMFMMVAASLTNGYVMPMIGYYTPWYVVGGVLITIGSALMYTVTSTTAVSSIYGFTVLLGIGCGLALNAAYAVGAAKVSSPSRTPAAIALMNVAQIGAIAHSLAISGVVFQNVAFDQLQSVFVSAGLSFSEEEVRQAVAGSRSAVFQSLSGSVRQEAVGAIVVAVQRVYILAIVAGAALLMASWGLRWERLFLSVVAGG